MSEEAQVFRGDRPTEESESNAPAKAKAKAKPDTLLAKADLPAGEPIGDHADAAATSAAAAELTAAAEIVAEAPAIPAEPEPELNFDIDPESLWSMPEAMLTRLSNLASAATVTHQRLDEQEKDTARIAKALRALR